MATDAWQVTRAGTLRLFRRGGQARQAAVETRLEDDAALVARSEDPERARQGLTPAWQLQLEAFLGEHPDAAAELSDLVARIQTALPQAQQNWVQNNIARENGQVFASQGGNVIVHQTPPGQPRPPAPAPDENTGNTP
jgi:hypothetical protein